MQTCAEATESAQLAHGEIAASGHDAVEHRADVSVGEEKHVLPCPIHAEMRRIDLHLVEIKGRDNVRRAQRAARVTRLAGMHHADDVAAHLGGYSF